LYPKKYEFFLKMGLREKDNPFRIKLPSKLDKAIVNVALGKNKV
jgi:hypothetical protein